MAEIHEMHLDAPSLKAAFRCFPSGVTALCALVDGQPVGMAVSSFTSVSLDPPLVSVCIQNSSSTWPILKTAERLGVSILGSDQHGAGHKLAAKTADRFQDIAWEASTAGAVFVSNAALHLACSIHKSIEAGDHEIVLLRLQNLRINPDVEPLVFHRSRFRRLEALTD